ncbi:septation protein A [Solimonas soli]|uniref:septation protein A n=1 Tax=Solimonas soli TaxID=413479 RepID=UPI000481C7E8|nr:septation protein A [Solimonas soli]
MNALIDFLPALLFLGAYAAYGIYAATAVLIVAMFALVAWYWFREKRLHKAHFVTALVALVLGGLTLYVHDASFIKFKPTAVYAVFALVLLGSHVIGDKVLLARLPQKTIELPDAVWRKVNFAWAVFFAFCAVLNLYVAYNFSEAAWVKFKTFGFTALMFVFLVGHAPFLKRYLPQE